MTAPPGLGIVTTDRDLLIRSWNDWLAASTGTPEASVLGTPLLDRVDAGRASVFTDLFDEVLTTGTIRVLAPAFHHYLIPCAPRMPSAHFEHMQQRVTVAPLTSDDGIVGLMVTIEDVTDRLDRERALAARLEGGQESPREAALAGVGAEDWKIRVAAVEHLRPRVSTEEVAHLLAAFQRDHQNLNVLSSALQVLIAADRDVIPALVDLLADPAPNVRMHAALALGELRTPDATSALIGALDDEDTNVRFHAIEALGRVASPAATEPLARIAQAGDFFVSFAAIDALAQIEDALVGPVLVDLLQHELLRPAAVDALAATGDEDAVAPLAALLSTNADVAPIAAALDRIHRRYEQSLGAGAHIIDLVRATVDARGIERLAAAVARRESPLSATVTVLGWMGGAGIDALMSVLGEPGIESSLGDAIAAVGSAAVPSLVVALQSGSREARLAAASLAGRIGDRRAVAPLVELLSGADNDLTAAAAAALARMADARALEGLFALFGHERASVRQAAISAVNAIGGDGIDPRIYAMLGADDPRVRESAVRVAGYFGFESCVPRILDAAHDPSEEVRRAVIEQLALVDDPRGVAQLIAALRGDSARNRAAAAHALRDAAAESATGALVDALSDPDAWVRYFAATSLGRRRDARAAGAVLQLARTDPAMHVRIAAIHALETLDTAALIRMAGEMTDSVPDDLVCAAIAGLSGVTGPAVEEILDRAAESPRPSVRAAVIQVLATQTSAKAATTLAWSARLTEPPSIPALAVDGLRRIAAAGDVAGRRAAVGALLDLGAQRVRRDDVLAAFGHLSAGAVGAIAEHLRHANVGIRLMAVHALARMRQPDASTALLAALDDESAEVRAAAVVAFGRLATRGAAPVISRMRDRDPDPGVRRRSAIVCDRLGWAAARGAAE